MFWLLAGYLWLFVHRPFEVWPTIGEFHLERVYMILTLIVWALIADKKWVANRLNGAFLALMMAVLLSWLLSPFMAVGTPTVEDYLKIAVFYVLLMSTIHTEADLKKITLAYLIATGLYFAHSLWEYRNGKHVYKMDTYRMVGVDLTYNDPNTFAATIVYSLNMILPFWMGADAPKWYRIPLLGYAGLCVLCVVLTGSRSGLIALGVLATFFALYSKHRLIYVALLMGCGALSWGYISEDLQSRFLTIFDPSYGPANAQESAETRSQGFVHGVRLWQEFPLTGCGPGAFPQASGSSLESHQLYGQVLGELGTLGAIAFLAVVIAFLRNAREMRKLYDAHPHWPKDFPFYLSRAVFLTLLLLLIMGLAGHNLYRYTWMWFGAFQAIALHVVRLRDGAESAS
jgi:hypothetical protein